MGEPSAGAVDERVERLKGGLAAPPSEGSNRAALGAATRQNLEDPGYI